MAELINYDTNTFIREATEEETKQSDQAARHDGGVGAILVEMDGEETRCYVDAN